MTNDRFPTRPDDPAFVSGGITVREYFAAMTIAMNTGVMNLAYTVPVSNNKQNWKECQKQFMLRIVCLYIRHRRTH